MKSTHDVLIIGGGTAGIMTAARLRREAKSLDIAIIEPSNTHYYQPAWTLVGAGTYDFDNTARPMSSVIPKGVTWIKDKATELHPENNEVVIVSGDAIGYKTLVVAPGLVMVPSMIEGLPEALDSGLAVSIYTDPKKTWETFKNFEGGNSLFTQPSTPIKCGGAPQKIAYLMADYLRKNNLSTKSNVIFATPGTVIFGVKEIKLTLEKVISRYGIIFRPFYNPVKIDNENRIVHFNLTSKADDKRAINKDIGETLVGDGDIQIPFDLLHLAPPQAAPKFVQESVLSNESGWLEVDKHSMVHKKYSNVFGLGDVAGVPTAKTGAAIRKQVPVVVNNVRAYLDDKLIKDKSYNGYSSCPLVTGYGKMVLAEFDYENNFTPDPKLKQMLVFDSSKEHWRLWMLKKYGLPYLYWNKMLKGVNV